MPINGKTDEAAFDNRSLQVFCRLWKGTPKTPKSSGTDLCEKFRFEASDATKSKFKDLYGTLHPTEVRIFLPHRTTDECFETWMEPYSAQGLKHRCNGDRIIHEKVKIPYEVRGKTQYRWERQDCDKPCLGKGKPTCPAGCGTVGRFFFYIQEFYTAGMGSTKCGMMSVTGIHDIVGFTQQLRGLENKYGCLHASPFPSPWTHGYIPYVLTRTEKTVMKPMGDHQAKGTTWTLSISEDPEWLSAMQRFQQAQEMMRLRDNPDVLQLLMPNIKIAGQIAAAPGPAIDNARSHQYQQINSHLKRTGIEESDHLRSLYNASNRYDLGDHQLDDYLATLKRMPDYTEPVEAEIVDEEVGDRQSLIDQIGVELLRLNWDAKTQGKAFLKDNYGKTARQQLTDDELEDCLDKLRSLEPKPVEAIATPAPVKPEKVGVDEVTRRLTAIAKVTRHKPDRALEVAEAELERDFEGLPIQADEVAVVRNALLMDAAMLWGMKKDAAIALLGELTAEFGDDDEQVTLKFMAVLQQGK